MDRESSVVDGLPSLMHIFISLACHRCSAHSAEFTRLL